MALLPNILETDAKVDQLVDLSPGYWVFEVNLKLKNDNNYLTLRDGDFVLGESVYRESVDRIDRFSLGGVIVRSFSTTIVNKNNRFDKLDFEGARLTVYYARVTKMRWDTSVYPPVLKASAVDKVLDYPEFFVTSVERTSNYHIKIKAECIMSCLRHVKSNRFDDESFSFNANAKKVDIARYYCAKAGITEATNNPSTYFYELGLSATLLGNTSRNVVLNDGEDAFEGMSQLGQYFCEFYELSSEKAKRRVFDRGVFAGKNMPIDDNYTRISGKETWIDCGDFFSYTNDNSGNKLIDAGLLSDTDYTLIRVRNNGSTSNYTSLGINGGALTDFNYHVVHAVTNTKIERVSRTITKGVAATKKGNSLQGRETIYSYTPVENEYIHLLENNIFTDHQYVTWVENATWSSVMDRYSKSDVTHYTIWPFYIQNYWLTFTPFSTKAFVNPHIGVTDPVVLVDEFGRLTKTFVTSVEHTIGGMSTIACDCESISENKQDVLNALNGEALRI